MRLVDGEGGERVGVEGADERPAPIEDRPPGVDPALDAVLVIAGPEPCRNPHVDASFLERATSVRVLFRHVF
jgi:hypothetical protein